MCGSHYISVEALVLRLEGVGVRRQKDMEL